MNAVKKYAPPSRPDWENQPLATVRLGEQTFFLYGCRSAQFNLSNLVNLFDLFDLSDLFDLVDLLDLFDLLDVFDLLYILDTYLL